MATAANDSRLVGLERLLRARPERPEELPLWRSQVREALAEIRSVVANAGLEAPGPMSARGSVVLRERSVLLGRVSRGRSLARGDPDLDRLTLELRRLVADIRHHVQRVHDLAYDEVEQELGGSE